MGNELFEYSKIGDSQHNNESSLTGPEEHDLRKGRPSVDLIRSRNDLSSYKLQAEIYDAVNEAKGKDYVREVSRLIGFISKYKLSDGNTLLDVVCGTGNHLSILQNYFNVQAVEVDPDMLSVAQTRIPQVPLYRGSMVDFDLQQEFDVVTSLFNAIAYSQDFEELVTVSRNLAKHTKPGGIILVEPFISPDKFVDGYTDMVVVDKLDLKIARANTSTRQGNQAMLNFHFLVAKPHVIYSFVEPHKITLFSDSEYREAFSEAGLNTYYDDEGLIGRGLYINTKPE